jgi:hypothetical protein
MDGFDVSGVEHYGCSTTVTVYVSVFKLAYCSNVTTDVTSCSSSDDSVQRMNDAS